MNGCRGGKRWLPVRVRRAVIRVCIAVVIASLAAQAAGFHPVHPVGLAVLFGVVIPATGVLAGLHYLRLTRGRP